jgi:hypothetical protein
MMLETTIASLMLNRESIGFGLDALAEFLADKLDLLTAVLNVFREALKAEAKLIEKDR